MRNDDDDIFESKVSEAKKALSVGSESERSERRQEISEDDIF